MAQHKHAGGDPFRISGGDAGIIMGVGFQTPYELWQTKTKRRPKDDLSGKESVYWGQRLEAPVLWETLERYGIPYSPGNQQVWVQNESGSRVGYLDYLHGDTIVEIKTTGQYSAGKWSEGVPAEYVCQVMHYFSLCPQAKTAIVACLIGGQKYVAYTLERDEEMIQQLLEMEETFYQCCVTDTPPAMEVVEGPQETYDMDPDVETCVEEYLEKKRALDALTKDVDALKSVLISLVGENRTQTGPRFQVAYSYVKQSRVDVDRLCADNNIDKKKYMSDGGYFKLVAKEMKR